MYALADAIGVYGLVLFLVAGLARDFIALSGFALAILYWLRPSGERVRSLLRQTDGT